MRELGRTNAWVQSGPVAGTMNKGMTLDACGQCFHVGRIRIWNVLGRLVYDAPGPTDCLGAPWVCLTCVDTC